MQYGATYPTVAEQQDRGAGYAVWINANNVLLSDNTKTASAVYVIEKTDYLIVRNFGFAIPEGEQVSHVVIDVECSGVKVLIGEELQLQEVADETVSLLIDGSISAVNLARPAEVWQDTDTNRLFVTAEPLTREQVNSENFGVVIAGQALSPIDPGATCNIDSITLTVYTRSGGIWRNSPMGNYSAINGMMGVK